MHLIIEAFRRAFKDRTSFLGDPDFSMLPANSSTKTMPRPGAPQSIQTAPTPSKDLQRPAIFNTLAQAETQQTQKTQPSAPRESTHTTHYSVVDADGNAVAVTTTSTTGSVPASPPKASASSSTTKWMISPRKQVRPMATASSKAPLIPCPGKRPLSSMAPTVVLKDGKLFLVLGSPGSRASSPR